MSEEIDHARSWNHSEGFIVFLSEISHWQCSIMRRGAICVQVWDIILYSFISHFYCYLERRLMGGKSWQRKTSLEVRQESNKRWWWLGVNFWRWIWTYPWYSKTTDLEIESTGFCDELECVGRQEAVNEEKVARKIELLLPGNSLVVQCLGLCPSTAGGMGLIHDQGTKIPHAIQPKAVISTWMKFTHMKKNDEIGMKNFFGIY